MSVTAVGHITVSGLPVVNTPSDQHVRHVELREAIQSARAEAALGNVRTAHGAVGRALEALHVLACLADEGEWSKAGWAQADAELWKALCAARGIAHHTSSGVVEYHGVEAVDERLRWTIDEDVARARPGRVAALSLHGRAALPDLERAAVITRPLPA
jgi:hypothetical protein